MTHSGVTTVPYWGDWEQEQYDAAPAITASAPNLKSLSGFEAVFNFVTIHNAIILYNSQRKY
jgi:hypothetical protein